MNFKLISFLLISTVMFFSNSLFANPIIILEDNASNYTQTADGYIVNFTFTANLTEFESIKSKADNMGGIIQFETTFLGNNTYGCTFTITHQNHPEYVHKMLLSVGFSQLEFKSESYNLFKIVEILKGYLND